MSLGALFAPGLAKNSGLATVAADPEGLCSLPFSLCLVRFLSRLASGVSGVLFRTGSFGAVRFLDPLDLVLLAFELGLCFFLPVRLAIWKVSMKSCGLA